MKTAKRPANRPKTFKEHGRALQTVISTSEDEPMPKTLNEPKRAPLNIRTTQERRDRLEALAKQNGLSLTAQVERLLEFAMDFEIIKEAIKKAPQRAP